MKKMVFFVLDTCELYYFSEYPGSLIELHGDVYLNMFQDEKEPDKFNGFLGFYDWLINSNNETIGVYLALEEFSEEVIKYINKYSNVVIDEDGLGFYIYFSDEREYIENKSNSQSFGCNKLYRSEKGQIAISFDVPKAISSKVLVYKKRDTDKIIK